MPKSEEWFSGKKWSWVKSIFHLETLFVIGFVVVIVYIIFRSPKKETMMFQDFVQYAKENTDYSDRYLMADRLPSNPVTTKKSKRVTTKALNEKRTGGRFNKCEERCREIFSEVFQCEFISVRPSFLKNPVTNRCLELDGYAEDIKTPIGTGLAFEYDGAQHSSYVKRWQRCPEEFQYQVQKDNFKDMRCKELNILLVRIPSFVHYDDLHRWILEKLKKLGFQKEVRMHEARLKAKGKPLPTSKFSMTDYNL